MARLSHSTLRTVRFYEEEGILRPARRSELDRLMLVTDMRMAGLSLDDIKAILEVKKAAATGAQAAGEVTRVLSARIEDLKEKLAVLTRLRDDLVETSKIVSSCLSCSDQSAFPNACDSCAVMTARPSLPRSMRVLWQVGQCGHTRATKEPSAATEAAPQPGGDKDTP
jgi:DNA-binding transcriptional MerR regulator